MDAEKNITAQIGSLISIVAQPEFWGGLLNFISSKIPFDTWCALHYKDGIPYVLSEFDDWDDGALFSKYLRHYYKTDPFYLTQAKDAKFNKWTLLREVIAPDFFDSPHYTEYLTHFHDDEASLRIDLRNNTYFELSIGRRGNFSDADLANLKKLQPVLVPLIQWRVWFDVTGSLLPQQSFRYSLEKLKEPLEKTLTAAESSVAMLIIQGASNRDIAVALGIKTSTVSKHVHNILQKTQTKTKHEFFKKLLEL
jgi:DNA-binding CsgD family transcriptional regulator